MNFKSTKKKGEREQTAVLIIGTIKYFSWVTGPLRPGPMNA